MMKVNFFAQEHRKEPVKQDVLLGICDPEGEQPAYTSTEQGMLEPDMDNNYTREISLLSQQMATYEDEYLNVLPLRQKSPLISMI